MTEEQLEEIFLDYFEDKLVVFPLKIGKYDISSHRRIQTYEEAIYDVMLRFSQRVNEEYLLNKDRWSKLLATTLFDYNPIENYRMTESGTDSKTYDGEEQLTRTVSAATYNTAKGWRVSGPASSDNSGTGPTMDYSHVHFKSEASNDLNSSSAGTGISGVSGATATVTRDGTGGSTATANPGTVNYNNAAADLPTTKSYTTTYDSASEGRLHDYNTTEGKTSAARQSTSQSVEDEPVIGEIWGGSNTDPFTDTKTYTDRTDENTHNLTRSGNIGVTTSQQMIQSERDLLMSAAKTILFELADELFLHTWN